MGAKYLMPQKPKTTMAYGRSHLYIIFLTTLMAVIGVSLISPAFPLIKAELGLDNSEVAMLVTVFTLPGIFLSPVWGMASDRRGRRPALVASLLLFGISGGAIAALRSYDAILVCRFLQGCAAAGLSTVSLALIGDWYQGEEREAVMGYNGSVLSIGTASYPSVGGLLAAVAWYAPFLVFLLALPLGAYVIWALKEPAGGRTTKDGATRMPCSVHLAGLLAVGVVTFVLLYGAYLTYLPQYLSDVHGSSSVQIGIFLSLMSVSTAVFSFRAGPIMARVGRRAPVVCSYVVYTGSLAILVAVSSVWAVPVAAVLFGVGQGLNLPALQVMVLGAADPAHRASVSALYASTLRVGQTIGPALFGAAYASGGYGAVFLWACVLAAATAVALFLWMAARGVGPEREDLYNRFDSLRL